MVNPELRRQVINVYKGRSRRIDHTMRKVSFWSRPLTCRMQSCFFLGENTPWDTNISEIDSIVRLRAKLICATRSESAKGLLGLSL